MSDFPSPETYSAAVSAGQIKWLKPQDETDVYPIVFNRGKGQYLYDLDGNKYIDYYLNNGSIILGHSSAHITPLIKNAISSGISLYGYNKYSYKLNKLFGNICEFKETAFYQSEVEALVYLVNLVKPETIGAGSSYLLKKLQSYFPGIKISKAEKNNYYDLAILEPIDFDNDLSDISYAHYKSRVICSYESRAAFRLKPGFIKKQSDCDFLLSSSNIANGLDCAVLMSDKPMKSGPVTQFQSAAIYETVKYYTLKINYNDFLVNADSKIILYKRANIFKIRSDLNPCGLIKYGIYIKGDICFISPVHTEHDINRLIKALENIKPGE